MEIKVDPNQSIPSFAHNSNLVICETPMEFQKNVTMREGRNC